MLCIVIEHVFFVLFCFVCQDHKVMNNSVYLLFLFVLYIHLASTQCRVDSYLKTNDQWSAHGSCNVTSCLTH